MSGIITSIVTWLFASDQPAHEIARKRVRTRLAGKVTEPKIEQAMARAERYVRGGGTVAEGVRRAVAWATCSIDPTPPRTPAQIAA